MFDFGMSERYGCPDCGIVPCSRHRKLSEDHRLYQHEVMELREENDKLRHEKAHLSKLLNSVEWGGHLTDTQNNEWEACPECGGLKPGDSTPDPYSMRKTCIGHREDCEIGKHAGNHT